ncbi:hypothetical protein O181_072042 [Austropuccinia psidii MF-1]|uniref:Uncharacterized protein n=1 Tax=Austropuccinia psidii MF-1 TaxID=1389203 RepID=A0A9Q3F6C4_9BASI|nr:hypothetical protein [Austropuccinia psidii MF-1]
MSSKLTSICDSNYSDFLPSLLHGAGVFDNFRELSEESMAPTEIYDINKNYKVFKSVGVIEPPCINCRKEGVPCVESATARSTRWQFCNLGTRNCSQANHSFSDNPRRLWSSIKKHQGESHINRQQLTSHCTVMRRRHCPHLRPHHSLRFHTPALTIFMLAECPHPYAYVVPSQDASDRAYHPYAHVVPSQHGSNTAYHPYACGVPSQHGSNTA